EAWNYPVTTTNEVGFSPQVVARLDGTPLLAYGQRDPDTDIYAQYVVGATDVTGQSWNLPVLVAPGTDMGQDTSMAILNTLPALAGRSGHIGGLNNAVTYVLAQNPQGASWTAPQTAVPSGNTYSSVR